MRWRIAKRAGHGRRRASDTRVYVDVFWMEATVVTNADFEKFVKATGYVNVTMAERTPTKEDIPMAPPESLVAGSIVFGPTSRPVPLTNSILNTPRMGKFSSDRSIRDYCDRVWKV